MPNDKFDVALSFAGEDRRYVEKVASVLKEMGLKVFYDKYEKATLWGKDLYEHLNFIYSKQANYTVMFISKYYKNKLWTNHERKSAQEKAFKQRKEYILPARFDKTTIPGILGTVGYINLLETDPEELADLIKEKIGPIDRKNFFPDNPDLLYQSLKARSDKKRTEIYWSAHTFFERLELMTKKERRILAFAGSHRCPASYPEWSAPLRLERFPI